ncbi:cytochrome C oxidase subunit IV family protein [Microvirga puerhi]|uniref:Cytochrome C oxidase subunit IV family protein n=1 Tax=Microvirga puerhi TaxID=2876078 RepID=A0ABS7VJK5_9HYPH|nr:cytochrome C oxidase subunit IV family protein [Microvirga puerhi]MBZ6075708.1 cytochrome C oxidase subunit IV family protein [Microvirga puerhi]
MARAQILQAILIWVLLLILLSLTVGASFLPLGRMNPVVSMGIALIKASLIFWFYMQLKKERGLVRLAALGAGAWLLILFLLVSSDVVTRGSF